MNDPHGESAPSMRRFLAGVFLLGSLITVPCEAVFGQTEPDVTFGGEIRPRMFGRETVLNPWDHWISMRTRVALDARFDDGIGFFVQLQDVRFWGEEASTRDTQGDAIDFYQAFISVDDLPGIGGSVRVGRQEVGLGEGRFIAAPNWGQGGQSFDGIRWTGNAAGLDLNLVYLRIREGSAPLHDQSADFTAGWGVRPLGRIGTLDFLMIHDRDRDVFRTDRTTVSSTWKTADGPLTFRLQGAYQFGDLAGKDLSAFLIAARGTAEVAGDRAWVTLWYDHLSGDDDPLDAEVEAFSNLYGARHRFYGRADYFRSIPEDLRGLGLRDLALKFELAPVPELSVFLDLHTFRTAAFGALTETHLGEELDLWARYPFREAMTLEAGYSMVAAGPAMKELELLRNTSHTLYVMTTVAF